MNPIKFTLYQSFPTITLRSLLLSVGVFPSLEAMALPVVWGDDVWQLQIDQTTSAPTHIETATMAAIQLNT